MIPTNSMKNSKLYHLKLYLHRVQSAYIVAQGNGKGGIYQNAQNEEPEPVEVSNTEALHHQLFQEH